MTTTGRILSAVCRFFGLNRTARPDVRFVLTNLTRRTRLASSVEVADTGAKRSRGLLGRSGLGPGEALWIVPCEAVHTFGMQFAIDLVYLDRQLRIRKIRRRVPPWRLSACFRAHSVIELAAGAIGDRDARPGDLLEFSPAAAESGTGGSVRAGNRKNPASRVQAGDR
jgi:uncharacterized protein